MKPNLNSNDPMAQRVLGTWYLAEAYALGEQGQRLHDVYGRRPSGVIHYGADGRMIALIAHDERPLLDGDRQAAPAEQRAAAYKSSMAYAGQFSFEDDWVLHHIDVSTYPNWVGTTLRRRAVWQDADLCLQTAPQMQDGVRTVIQLIWQREPIGV